MVFVNLVETLERYLKEVAAECVDCMLSKTQIDAPRMVVPSKSNLLWLKMFLETAEDCNQRIGQRLSAPLTKIHADSPSLIQPQPIADKIASIFRIPLQVAAAVGVISSD